MKDKLIGLFLVLMGVVWAGMGGSELRDNMATRAPTPLAWAQFVAEKPSSGWFKVSGAQLDLTGALWIENRLTGEMGNVYVPARAAGAALEFEPTEVEPPTEMLVKVDDPKIIATVQELKKLETGTDEAVMNYVLGHAEQLFIERPLVGTLAEGFDAADSGDESTLRSAEDTLASDFVILQEGAKPDVGGRIFMLLGGLGVTLLGLFYIFLKKPAAPTAPPTASGFPPVSK